LVRRAFGLGPTQQNLGKAPHQVGPILAQLAVFLEHVDHNGQQVRIAGHFQQVMSAIVALGQSLP
jgi:hypothetical protein